MQHLLFRVFSFLGIIFSMPSCHSPASALPSATIDYGKVVAALEEAIEFEIADKELPAVSIILIEDDRTVWTKGFGFVDRDKSVPANNQTIYRVGSVSKLFTDIGIMQLVEKGEIDLDQPITAYLPDFRPENPFGGHITLRQLMSHRAGLIREPPVGHYFDDQGRTLAETVESINNTSLVYKPETRIKYSNAGIAVAGFVMEHLMQEPFSHYLKEAGYSTTGALEQ